MALAFGLVLTLFSGTTLYAVLQMRGIERDMRQAAQAQTEISERAGAMRRSINDIYFTSLLMVLATQAEDVKYYGEAISRARQAYDKSKASLLERTNGGASVPGLKAAMQKVIESEDMLLMIDQVVSRRMTLTSSVTGDGTLATEESVIGTVTTLVKGQFDVWAKGVDELVAVTDAHAKERQAGASQAANLAQGVQIGASLAALAIGVLAAWWITRNVTRPIRQAVQVAERVAHGDLAFDIPQGGGDETGALLEALARMQSSLNALVSEVRDAASSIAVASSEVAMGNNDLSQRTESAASHLQHTTGSIDQLSEAVHRSADSARTADKLANHAAQAAQNCGEVVMKAVQSMQDIAAQSKRIGDIIGVIEGIAFQTNILALNAAVEAASAGEQGRGFAVVAGEVRNLAQRSATAAKDIAALIQTSMNSVTLGSTLVQDAGTNMEGIVQSVHKVTTAIEEISQAAHAQSDDLKKIGTSMYDIDRMTQQNAALVEQSAAAAESLKGQSQRLAQMVTMFRLKGRND